jgi:ketosteroid isomerase-like protein
VAAAFDALDADEYVRHMTEDVVAIPPGFLVGRRELRGHEQLKAAFADGMAKLGPARKLHVSNRRYVLDRADETKVLAVIEMTISAEGGDELETFGTETAIVFTLNDDSKVSRLESWPSMAEGLAQLEDPVAIDT